MFWKRHAPPERQPNGQGPFDIMLAGDLDLAADGNREAEGRLEHALTMLPWPAVARPEFGKRPLRLYTRSPHLLRRLQRHEAGWAMVACSLFNANGRIREAALRSADSKEHRLLPYLVLRCNDWVDAIARIAQDRVLAMIPASAPEIVAGAMCGFERLRMSRRRDHADFMAQVENLLCAMPEALEFARRSEEVRVRRWAASLQARSKVFDPERYASENLDSSDPRIREMAARVLGTLDPKARREGAWKLAGDVQTSLRLLSLDVVSGTDRQDLAHALALDSRWHVRAAARYHLELMGSPIGGDFYRSRLPVPGAIAGLADLGVRDLPAELLESASPQVRQQMAWAAGQLGIVEFADPLIRLLFDRNHKVVQAAVAAIRKMRLTLDPETVSRFAASRPSLAYSILPTLHAWDALCLLLTLGERDAHRLGVERALEHWLDQRRWSASPVDAARLDAAARALTKARSWLSPELVTAIEAEISIARAR